MIGVYDPYIPVTGGDEAVSSRAAEPFELEVQTAYHLDCYERLSAKPDLRR